MLEQKPDVARLAPVRDKPPWRLLTCRELEPHLMLELDPTSRDQLVRLCKKWKVLSLALFGSALRDDLRPESDVDLLVTFVPDAEWSLFDHLRFAQELETLFGRRVDLVSRRALEGSRNEVRRDEILRTARVLYAA